MNFKSLTETFSLSDGNKIPCIGFGTWQSADGEECYNAVTAALECGYRHIDTAEGYGNEESVGRAISDFLKKNTCKRSDLFITTKLHNNFHSYEEAKNAIEKSLKALQLEYLAKSHQNQTNLATIKCSSMESHGRSCKSRKNPFSWNKQFPKSSY